MDVPAGHIEGLIKEQEDKYKNIIENQEEEIRKLKHRLSLVQEIGKDLLERVEPLVGIARLQLPSHAIYKLAAKVFDALEPFSIEICLNEKDVKQWVWDLCNKAKISETNRLLKAIEEKKHFYPWGEPDCAFCKAFGPSEDDMPCFNIKEHDRHLWARAVDHVTDFLKANPMEGERVHARCVAVTEGLREGPRD